MDPKAMQRGGVMAGRRLDTGGRQASRVAWGVCKAKERQATHEGKMEEKREASTWGRLQAYPACQGKADTQSEHTI